MIIGANGIQLWYDTFGAASHPAILLMMGNSAQGILWPEELCRALAAAGYHVIRFDQRDTGLSTYVDFDAQPYDLLDLVADALGLLDALRIQRAHVVGLSQGGTLAYLMAGLHPARVLSLTAIMSSPDMSPKNDAFAGKSPRPGALPPPDPAFVAGVIAVNARAPENDAEAVTQLVDNFRLAKGPVSPFDEGFWRELMTRFVERPRSRADGRTAKVANHGNHAKAQAATPPLSAADLGRIQVPALIIHGTHDPIFPPAHAQWAAGAIPGARLRLVDGMGHAFDPAFFEEIAGAIVEHVSGKRGTTPLHPLAPSRRSMGPFPVKGWGMCGSRGQAYSAEPTQEAHEGKPVVRLWRSTEGSDGFGAMFQMFKPDRYRGKRVRFSAAVRTAGEAVRAALCLRVDGPETPRTSRSLAFDNMDDRPISGTTEWARYACVVDVAPEATAIFISNILYGQGELFWADVRFEVVDDSVPVTDVFAQALPDEPVNLDFSQT